MKKLELTLEYEKDKVEHMVWIR